MAMAILLLTHFIELACHGGKLLTQHPGIFLIDPRIFFLERDVQRQHLRRGQVLESSLHDLLYPGMGPSSAFIVRGSIASWKEPAGRVNESPSVRRDRTAAQASRPPVAAGRLRHSWAKT